MPVAAALIPAAISAGVGLYNVLFSGKKKAQQNLENQVNRSPMYGGSKAVNDYYQEAYNRYSTAPENTAMYQNMMKNIGISRANTLGGLQDRRGALDAVGQLESSGLAATGNALANAENMRNQRFGALGQATQMQNADQMQKFNINQLMPYQNKVSLLSAKSQAANQKFNTGLQQIAGAASSAATAYGAYKEGGGGGWWKA